MKAVLQYLILATWLYGGLAWSQSAPPAQTETERLDLSFQKKRLNRSQLEAFQKRAEQKARDWVEYIQAVTDRDYPEDMREHMGKMARSMLSDSNAVVFGKTFDEYWVDLARLNHPLTLPLETKAWQDWKRISNTHYKALLSMEDQAGTPVQLEVRLALNPKQFGSKTTFIWNISFDSIY